MKTTLLSLLKKHSYKTGDFTLSSGKKSSYFIDCKTTLLQFQGHWTSGTLINNEIISFMKTYDIKVNAVAGVALGGCSLASSTSTLSGMNLEKGQIFDALYVRKETKDHGTKKLVEGFVEKGSNVALLEDTITTGGSTINAINILKNEGYNPVVVICVVDRLEGGKVAIEEKFSIPVISLFTIKDIQKEDLF